MSSNRQNPAASPAHHVRWWKRRWFKVVVSLGCLACLALLVAAEYVLHHAEPIVRKRVIETLSKRFNAPVELDHLDISLFRGIEVQGYGLRVGYGAGTFPVLPGHPMVAVEHFAFHTGIRGLLRQPTHVAMARVDGMTLYIPPVGDREELHTAQNRHADPDDPKLKPKIAIIVNELDCRNIRLFIESNKPGPENGHKLPLEFDIARLNLQDVGRDQAMRYDAELTNPKPIGAIHAVGHFGPWGGGVPGGEPGKTPVDGNYSFDHADLGTIKGIGGMLSSVGHFAGVLDRITIDGETDTPRFSLDISEHPLHLHTVFHAIVDGTNGDTELQPVQARLANSEFTTSGKIVKVEGGGHDIQLDVDIPHGRMQDFLQLAVKTDPPLMNGTLTMKARLHIPPGKQRVPAKLGMSGRFSLRDVRFNNLKLQNRIDGLSARAQGKPDEVAEVSHDQRTEAHSQLAANFTIGGGVVMVAGVHYAIPGATVLLNGVYSMNGRLFEFKGKVRTEATASEMVGGWKGILLKPINKLLEHNGAGVELPIEISGTKGDVHMGLAIHGADDTPAQLLADMQGKAKARAELDSARRDAAEAGVEDRQAAHAATLDEAERAHNAAVRHRTEAQSRALAARKAAGTSNP